jgi:hypothetical protein
MFSILIHADLYELLRGSSRALRTRVRKTMLRLRDGQWSGGTRVKRLRGVNRPLFEARTDRGDRLLFTAIRSADPSHPDRLATYLQVWDVVSHDAVNRVARRNRSAEAEFLEFSAEEQFEIHEPPPVPEATLDAFPSEDGVDPLLHFLLPPDGYSPRSDEGITGGVRWFQTPGAMLADDDEFQRIIDHEVSTMSCSLRALRSWPAAREAARRRSPFIALPMRRQRIPHCEHCTSPIAAGWSTMHAASTTTSWRRADKRRRRRSSRHSQTFTFV